MKYAQTIAEWNVIRSKQKKNLCSGEEDEACDVCCVSYVNMRWTVLNKPGSQIA